MGIGLLCGVAFCFLGVGLLNAQVTQTPRHLIKKVGAKVLLKCSQNMDHEGMFWYRQDPGLGLRLLHWSYNTDGIETGDIPYGYSVSRKKKDAFPLILESAGINQTSVYFCASS
ncbi:T cell receptor beta variable 28 [Vulpes lagopus]